MDWERAKRFLWSSVLILTVYGKYPTEESHVSGRFSHLLRLFCDIFLLAKVNIRIFKCNFGCRNLLLSRYVLVSEL